ncbi:collagen-like protein [uncultured Pseudomonas sp.]|uniref:collagen-like protein n=1 Tax=uncultured Pseudomonas sp. TaxID=114707 RepID=UPI0026332C27|nr:collagen-like protein [uncultured Pseudomonas sp.]
MRKLLALTALFSPLVLAQAVIEVDSHAFMRLPSNTSVLLLDRLEIADHGTLLIPAGLTEIRVAQLRLGREARLAIAPSEQALRLEVANAEIASGAQISARGAQGGAETPALPGRDLSVRLQVVTVESLILDARGGAGAPGYAGLAGADGKPGGCTWGEASGGHDGLDGGDGQPGAAGAQVRLEVPQGFPVEQLQVRVDGGSGGQPGAPGAAGQGGMSKGCWVYSTDGARDGKPGQAGRAGEAGPAGALNVVRF